MTSSPALHLGVKLSMDPLGETKGRILVQAATGLGQAKDWSTLGQVAFREASAPSAIDAAVARRRPSTGRSDRPSSPRRWPVAPTTARPCGSRTGCPSPWPTSRIKAGSSAGSPTLDLKGFGVGPGRSGLATIPAANGSVDRVELNGL